jgi:CBS domain-containing protein
MLTLLELMTPEVVTLHPDMSLRDAVEELSANGFSGAPVVAQGRLVGVVSTSDILDFESATPGVPSYRAEQQEWGDWGPAQRWEEEVSEPPAAYFRDLWADSGAELVERMGAPESPEWDWLAEHVVAEVMTRKVLALPPNTPAAEAAGVMARSGVHRILVTVDDELVGLVSAMDFVRAVAEGKLEGRSS